MFFTPELLTAAGLFRPPGRAVYNDKMVARKAKRFAKRNPSPPKPFPFFSFVSQCVAVYRPASSVLIPGWSSAIIVS